MIEKLFKNDLSLKRYRVFKSNKRAVISLLVLLVVMFLSLSAEYWANSKPLILKYKGSWYFPITKSYVAKDFGQKGAILADYRKLKEVDFAIWPLILWDPFESNKKVASYPAPPSFDNLLGTDDRGRDILSRLLYGFRYSMTYALVVWIITFLVGTLVGGFMGFHGGKIDFYAQRVVEILSTVPQFFLLIIIISVFKPSLSLLIIISSIFGWISISYYVRGEFLKNRRQDYAQAATALGASQVRIFFCHILPNSLSPIITFSPFVIAGNVVALASLDYLGFGLTPPTPSWGELLSQAQKNISIAWWLALFPSLSLFFTLTMLSLIGEAVRDAMDPKIL